MSPDKIKAQSYGEISFVCANCKTCEATETKLYCTYECKDLVVDTEVSANGSCNFWSRK